MRDDEVLTGRRRVFHVASGTRYVGCEDLTTLAVKMLRGERPAGEVDHPEPAGPVGSAAPVPDGHCS